MSPKENVLTPEPVVGHGNTPAAWTFVFVTTIGLILAVIGFDTFHAVLITIGLIIAAAGIVLGLVLKAVGFGKNGSRLKSHE